MRKVLTLIVLLAFFVMSFAPAIVAAPPSGDGGFSVNNNSTDGEDPPTDPPVDPPDGDPWSPGSKIVPLSGDDDNIKTDFWILIKIWSVKVICSF
ncbi:MAG: hypothetical protein DRP46_07500 [Candidatus Zixiibacteriota bacterium]|nr:MAG: hypothetical protein DRP46_07500 [candidate division Zixibacteria bacterium]